jgi:hypothetical protein
MKDNAPNLHIKFKIQHGCHKSIVRAATTLVTNAMGLGKINAKHAVLMEIVDQHSIEFLY